MTYMLFNQDFEYVSGNFYQVEDITIHGTLSTQVTVPEGGFLYVYLSNENPNNFDVHFDDFFITHTKSTILQEDHYYPYGMNIGALSSTAPQAKSNQYKYNGFEEQTDFDLGWYDYMARYYDPQLGRFNQVDPAANEMRRHSPYNYAFNNPMRFIDPDGMMPTDPNTTSTTVQSTADNEDIITEVSSETIETKSKITSESPEYQEAILDARANDRTSPNGVKKEAVLTTRTVTTTVTTSTLKFDGNGKLLGVSHSQAVITSIKRSVQFEDQFGGDGGGSVLENSIGIDDFVGSDVNVSDNQQGFIDGAVDFRRENKLSITNRFDFNDELAVLARGEANMSATFSFMGVMLGAMGALGVQGLEGLSGLVIGSVHSLSGDIGSGIASGTQSRIRAKGKANQCNVCTKLYQGGVNSNGIKR